MRYTSLLALCSVASATVPSTQHRHPSQPQAPGLEYLYTAYVECLNNIYNSQGPRGIRTAIPIVGGNVTGPRINGKILDVGADWGLTDPATGIFSADTRYNVQTDDGANIFLQTSGPAQPNGNLHLRLVFETGDLNYYWLNNIVAVGVLSAVSSTNTSFLLKIDAWHLSGEWTNTTFVNGSTYPAA
ncbi:hypothetical protein LTR95_006932 [Oleoguttula sp. CCFEE 5521]